jgi:hypothetical protein
MPDREQRLQFAADLTLRYWGFAVGVDTYDYKKENWGLMIHILCFRFHIVKCK